MGNTRNKNSILIEVSTEANNQFKNILEGEISRSYIRLIVDSGGCSGFSYKFSVDDKEIKQNDIVISSENNKKILVVDEISLNYLKNSKIEWQNDLTGSQFVIDNPLAKSKCGCGSSFSL